MSRIFDYRFCVGDRFYLCENKILCEYDYEERLVFASMANHPMLKRQANHLSPQGVGQSHGGGGVGGSNPPPSSQHGIMSGMHQQQQGGIHSPVNGPPHNNSSMATGHLTTLGGQHRGSPQGDLNNNHSHSNNHNGAVSPFSNIKQQPPSQHQLGATS